VTNFIKRQLLLYFQFTCSRSSSAAFNSKLNQQWGDLTGGLALGMIPGSFLLSTRLAAALRSGIV